MLTFFQARGDSPTASGLFFIGADRGVLYSETLSMTALGKHDLLIAMAHSFQGEKRDVMFLSFAMDPASHLVTLRFLNRPDVFNVSITRIRIEQRFYVSCDVLPGRAQTQSPAVYEMVDGSVEIYRGRRGDGSSLT